jgi:hypothetical protein
MKLIKKYKVLLIFLTLLIFISLAFLLPRVLRYSAASPCAERESDAANIAYAINLFCSTSKDNMVPSIEDIVKMTGVSKPFAFCVCDDKIIVHVFDVKGECRKFSKNYDSLPGWNHDVYTGVYTEEFYKTNKGDVHDK